VKFYLRLLPYLRQYWHLALVAALVTTLIALFGLLLPWPMTILVDNVLGDRPLLPVLSTFLGWLASSKGGLLAFVVGAEIILALAIGSMNVVNEYVQTRMTQLMSVHFRGDIYAHAQRMSLGYHARRLPGQLIYAINVEADIVVQFILVSIPMAQSALTIIGMVWILFVIDRELALISLITVPLLHYTVRYYSQYIPTWLTRANNFAFLLVQMIHESIAMLPVIAAFGREDYEHRRYREQGRRSIDMHLALGIRQTVFALVVNMITTVGTALVLGFGAYQVLQGHLTVGQLLVVLAYIAAAYKPLETISTTIGSLQNLFVIMQRIFDVLDTAPEIEDQAGAISMARARGHVRYQGVRFHHHGRPTTLEAISLEAAPGQLIAIVGPTGAGKTSLLNLLPRFYEPQDGRILLDGHDIRTLTLASLRQQISIVAQEPLLFSGTIAENIRYGRLEASDEDVIAAATAAAAHDFIMRLPAQYNTLVGERGAQLSGGERQRLCIARAFLKDAPILILDEPTAAIDTQTEQSILAALERLMMGRTTFVVAHRLSTIRHADQIVVLQDGRVSEQGTHAELLARRGLYHQLSLAQSASTDPIDRAQSANFGYGETIS
jgi:ATP-binding cassette, subfamily B, bacterial